MQVKGNNITTVKMTKDEWLPIIVEHLSEQHELHEFEASQYVTVKLNDKEELSIVYHKAVDTDLS
jgi:hypothetical protein